jgi:TRAP transporter TAXI family solute receptor
MAMRRRRNMAIAASIGLVLLIAGPAIIAQAQDIRFFRIATGSISGTYFPIGSLIANIISRPPGSRPCEAGGSCGVPGLIATAQTTHGSVDNIDQIARGEMDSGLAQSDVVHWAFFGQGMFADDGPRDGIRAIARLYPETFHLIVRKDQRIETIADLTGRRISIGDKGSGTAISADIIMSAHGLTAGNYETVYAAPEDSAAKLRKGEIDAFVLMAGFPIAIVEHLADDTEIALLPVDPDVTRTLLAKQPFLSATEIPSGLYGGNEATPSVSVNAQWIVSAATDAELVYQITKAIWHPANRKLLDQDHPDAQDIRLEQALDGISIPLHLGAQRFYREVGMLKPPTTGKDNK